MNQPAYFLFDIEGTVSDILFVKKIMFPYSQARLQSFCEQHIQDSRVKDVLANRTIQELDDLLKRDVKDPYLKQLQGLIWEEGFRCGDLVSPLYEDAYAFIKGLKNNGQRAGIYSSGSRQAQLSFFAHTQYGNLLPWFEDHFDLSIGSKVSKQSYLDIAKILKLEPHQIMFFTDLDAEVEAAQQAGLEVRQLLRSVPPEQILGEYQIRSFSELSFPATV